MTAPPSSLDRILRWKQQQRQQSESRLKRLLAKKRKIELEFADIRGEVEALARAQESPVLADLEAQTRYARRLESLLEEVRKRLLESQELWSTARRNYEQLTRELDALQSVREKQAERHAKQVQRNLYGWLDDIEMSKWEVESGEGLGPRS